MRKKLFQIINPNNIENIDVFRAVQKSSINYGVEYCLVSNIANVDKGIISIDDAKKILIKNDTDEVWVFSDALIGPMFEMSKMLEDVNKEISDIWQVCDNSEFYGFRKNSFKILIEWFNIGAKFDSLPLIINNRDIKIVSLIEHSSAYSNLFLENPIYILKEKSYPFFMHKVFNRNYAYVLNGSIGNMGQELYEHILKCKDFDVNVLWDFLLKTKHQEDIFYNMHLQYTLSSSISPKKKIEEHLKEHKIALTMHLYYPELIDQCVNYAKNFPAGTDVYVTTNNEEKKEKIEQAFIRAKYKNYEVRVIGNRGRDVSALLVGLADVLEKYEYICFYHDKKVLQLKPGSKGVGFSYICVDNLFPSENFINNVIDLFAKEERLGILTPPNPYHAEYFGTIGFKWGPNYKKTYELYKRLNLSVPISEQKRPIAPLGTCFWFRSKALKKLIDYGWKYEDFPPEPNDIDGTLLHAVERIYPFVAQEEGYYSAYSYSDNYAAIQYSNFYYFISGYQKSLFKNGIRGKQHEMMNKADEKLKSLI